jgi:hypothetical protein
MGRKDKKKKKRKKKKKVEDNSEKIKQKEAKFRDPDPSIPNNIYFHQNAFGKLSKKFVLKSDQCYIIVVDDLKTIFVWKGIYSSVRSKFILSRKCSEIQHQLAAIGKYRYKIITQDQGEEDPAFILIFGDIRKPQTIMKILDSLISSIKTNPSIKMVYIKLFLDRFHEISDQDKVKILQDIKDIDPDKLKDYFRDRFPGSPFPYIPKPPSPPDDLDEAVQIQLLGKQKEEDEDKEYEISRFCEYCGAPLEDGVSVCPNCGKKI